MRKGQRHGNWKQSVEKLKEKWSALTRGIILAIAEEEMRISREEFDKQIEARAFQTHPIAGGGRCNLQKNKGVGRLFSGTIYNAPPSPARK